MPYAEPVDFIMRMQYELTLLADRSFLEATLLTGSGFTLERNSFRNESHSSII